MEKKIADPKKKKDQILWDNYGNIIYFYEKECLGSRKHQKIIKN
ncbi:hypothetical protein, partial [Clostridioides difficile]